jgi:hypothetical protein
MQLSKFITALTATALLAISATAQSSDTLATDNTSTEAVVSRSQMRNDRGLSNLKNNIVPKGQWVFGGSLTYSTHTNSDYSLLIVDGIDSKGYTVKVSPLVGYSLTPNSIIGVRGVYSRGYLNLDSASVSLGEGDGALGVNVDFYYMLKHSYDVAAIWRQYIPLGMNKRIGLFAEFQLSAGGSQAKFAEGSPIRGTYATGFNIALGVNPGVVAWMTNNIALELNVGILGLGYSHTRQIHNQVATGDTSSSLMNFNINILSIGLGVAFYI